MSWSSKRRGEVVEQDFFHDLSVEKFDVFAVIKQRDSTSVRVDEIMVEKKSIPRLIEILKEVSDGVE